MAVLLWKRGTVFPGLGRFRCVMALWRRMRSIGIPTGSQGHWTVDLVWFSMAFPPMKWTSFTLSSGKAVQSKIRGGLSSTETVSCFIQARAIEGVLEAGDWYRMTEGLACLSVHLCTQMYGDGILRTEQCSPL